MKSTIITTKIETPIGEMIAGATDRGLCLLEFCDRPALPKEIDELQRLLDAEIDEGEHQILNQTRKEIKEYFMGSRKSFDVVLNPPGSQFQMKVWKLLTEIPYGETSSYKSQSVRLGNVKAIRAVGKANGENRISIIIPCHRVIGQNGDLIGYGGGIWRKQFLLEFEAKISNNYSLLF